jgi:hypothetical protein
MIATIRHEQWQRRESIQYSVSCVRPGEPLQELLQNEAGGKEALSRLDGPTQFGGLLG